MRKLFSVVMPIHNEAKFLPYSLPSIFQLEPNEVILVFDRCTDKSLEITMNIAKRHKYLHRTYPIVIDFESPDWQFRPAFLRRFGYRMARNEYILSTDADIMLDSEIKEHFHLLEQGNIGLISFEYIDYPINWRNLLKRFYEALRLPFPWLSGIKLFRRQAWKETEDVEAIKQVESAEDTFLHNAIRTKYRTKIFLSRCYHLRPREDPSYFRGRLYWNVAKRSFLTTMLSGLALLRLSLIKGYIHERWGR